MAIVIVLLDAFRSDYLTESNTPFLHLCARTGRYYRRVVPSLGYCERTEIMTGRGPRDSGFFTAIGFAPERSPYAASARTLRTLDAVERRLQPYVLRRGFRRLLLLTSWCRSPAMRAYQIPLKWLPYFALTEDEYDHRDPRAFNSPSLFDVIRARGLRLYYDSFTALNMAPSGSDEQRLSMALAAAQGTSYEVFFVYIAAPDKLGHLYGPSATSLGPGLRNLDHQLRFFAESFAKIRPKSTFVFIGDHGMVPVDRTFDAGARLARVVRRAGFQMTSDVIYFLDSTIVRVWFGSDRARHLLCKQLLTDVGFRNHGRFVDIADRAQMDIPDDRRYGDMLWLADKGVLVFPDFFHTSTPYRGMHGYDPLLSESQGMCIVIGPNVNAGIVEVIRLTEVNGLLTMELEQQESSSQAVVRR